MRDYYFLKEKYEEDNISLKNKFLQDIKKLRENCSHFSTSLTIDCNGLGQDREVCSVCGVVLKKAKPRVRKVSVYALVEALETALKEDGRKA